LVAGGLALAGSVVVLRPGTRANKMMCHELDRAGRRVRYLGGRLQGVSYRLRGRHPETDVIDNVLADRIRSSLGGLEKRLDLPHIHVMVENHVALLHGEVSSDADAAELERAVGAVPGVTGVESYLHVGLIASDSRPSEGRAMQAPSPALRRLCDSAITAGVDEAVALPVVRGILATLADRLPAGDRDRVSAHLPADVRVLFSPPRRVSGAAPPRTVNDLVARITAGTVELPPDKAEGATSAVIETLRETVPDEAHAIGAVLPADLRAFWEGYATEQSPPSTD
jgi:uncharacterized protein (DUF2267 family)